jgi:nucleotide-binding universal stress UspA family protein
MTACHDTSTWGPSGSLPALSFRHIVVGVDGSPNSVAALRVAGRLALRDGAKIEAVCVYQPNVQAQYPFAMAIPPYGPAGEGTRDAYASSDAVPDLTLDAQATLEKSILAAFGSQTFDNLTLRPVEGTPRDVLTRISATSDLLVVGAHGHSGPFGLLIGSTAQGCARHATCAVLIVPAPHEAQAAEVDAHNADRLASAL